MIDSIKNTATVLSESYNGELRFDFLGAVSGGAASFPLKATIGVVETRVTGLLNVIPPSTGYVAHMFSTEMKKHGYHVEQPSRVTKEKTGNMVKYEIEYSLT